MVTVSATGIALGVGTGSVQISATVGGLTAMTQAVTVTPATLVSIILSPTSTSFADGTTVQFMATGTFSDGSSQNLTSQVVWSSSNAQVLTISTSGLASGNGVGNVQIWASSNGVSAYSGTIQVTQAVLTGIVLTPSSAQIAKGTSQQFTATGQFTDGTTQNLSSNVTWISSNPTVVTISATGLATATGIGTAQITALFGGQSASTSSFAVTPATLLSIAFNPPSPSIAAGTAAQISVIGTFSDGTMQDLTASAQFVSSNPAVVMINSSGMATGVTAVAAP